MKNKLIPKYQHSGKFEEKSDNTRTLNYSVPVVPKERYTPKVTLLQKYANKPQPQVLMSSDNRTEYLKKRGNDVGRDTQRQVREQKAKLQVGNIAALAGIAGAQLIPGLNTAVNIGLGLNSAAHLISDEGIKKTVGAINDGDYITAVQSGAGDLFDLGLIKLGTRSAKVAPRLLYSAGKWLYNKGFDAYHNTFGLGKPNGGFTKVVNNDGTINLRLPSHSSSTPRQLTIEPQGNNSFRVHVNTWGGVSPLEKQQLYEVLYKELPENAKILFPESNPDYLATRGTVASLLRLKRDPRFTPGSTLQKLMYKDKDGSIKFFEGTSFTKKPTVSSINYIPNQQQATGKTSLAFFENPSKNTVNITPEQWTAAQDAAIAKGDVAEAQRLRDLHFKIKALKNKLTDKNGNPVAVKHHGNVWNVFNPDRTMSGTLWTANEDAFKLNDIKTFPASDLPTEWKNLYINMKNPIQDEVSIGTTRMLSEIRKGSKDAIKESIRNYGISNPDGVFNRIKITEDFLKKNGYDLNDPEIQEILNNPEFYGKEPTIAATAYPNNIKLADAVTYDDNGVRIPLGKRDNFNVNDIRYGLVPWLIGGTTAGYLYNNKQ